MEVENTFQNDEEQTCLLEVNFSDANYILNKKYHYEYKPDNKRLAKYLLTETDISYSEVLKTIFKMLKAENKYYEFEGQKIFTLNIPKSWYIGCQFKYVDKFIRYLKGIDVLSVYDNTHDEEDIFKYKKIHQLSNAFLLSDELPFVKKLQKYFEKEENDLLKSEENDSEDDD